MDWLKLKDILIGLSCVLGILSSLKSFDVPFWAYVIILVAYGGLRLAKKDDFSI